MDVSNLQMQLIDFKAYLLYTCRFINFSKLLDTIKSKQETFVLEYQKFLPYKISCVKEVGTALLSAFEFTDYVNKHYRTRSSFLGPMQPTCRLYFEPCVQLKLCESVQI